MTLFLRSRGLLWSVPGALVAVAVAAYLAHLLESQTMFGPMDRVPAVVLGALMGAVLLAPGMHRVDDEVEGAAPRPMRRVELALIMGSVATVAAAAVVAIPLAPWERGGLELARDLVGLAGLGLVGGSVTGSRLAWLLPIGWMAASYLAVTRQYDDAAHLAPVGWLMFPATWVVTWWVAGLLFLIGLAAHSWGGFIPRPRRHLLR